MTGMKHVSTNALVAKTNAHSTRSTLHVRKWGVRHLWSFYSKEIPSIFDAFAKSDTIIIIFQIKKGYCSRCLGDAGGVPMIEYGNKDFSRIGVPQWNCIVSMDTVEGTVFLDPHGHIFVLICPGVPNATKIHVQAEAVGERAIIYPNIEYDDVDSGASYRLAACTMVKSDIIINDLREWIEFHQNQGWDHFSVYVDGPLERLLTAFQSDHRTVNIVDWQWPEEGFQNQQAEMNSCLYRYRGIAEWVAFHDIDEFFQPIHSHFSILDLLKRVPIEFGGWGARHVLFPRTSNGTLGGLVTQTVMQRSLEALPFTVRSKCIVRPREVSTMGVHEITSGNTRTWVADPVTEARLNHYRGGLEWEGEFVHDTSMQHYANTLNAETGRRPFVAVYLTGGMGNQLFQAASSLGIAHERGAEWCIPYLEGSILQQNVLFRTSPRTDCVPENVHMADEAGDFLRFQEWMLHDHPGESVRVGVYLQSFRYFAHLSTLPFELKKQEWANDWVHSNNITTGIHVRRTDMLENLGNDPTIAYFIEALSQLRDEIGPIQGRNFVVCTDDPEWVYTHGNVFGGMHLRTETDSSEDLAILAACQHLIISIGTFGWWAAYLRASPGYTYYYAKPLRLPPFSYTDFFPDSWIPIS